MELSAGVIITNKEGLILGCKAFGKAGDRPSNYLDLPKGHVEAGESPLEAAIRETFEETGISLKGVKLTDLGRHPYIKGKDLHLFSCVYNAKLPRLECTTFFEMYGKRFPEVIGYEWVEPDKMTSKFYKSLVPILTGLI